jgi:hypothetical protein
VKVLVLAFCSLALACHDASEPYRPIPLGPQARFAVSAGARCRTDSTFYNLGGRSPHHLCEVIDRRGRVSANYLVDASDSVVSTVQSRSVPGGERSLLLAQEAHRVSEQLGSGALCAQSAYWKLNGWYVLLHLRASSDVFPEADKLPWELSTYTARGGVRDAFECAHPSIAT